MKGIGILLVIIGHVSGIPDWLHAFIYSFHMPLFFLISGYLMHGGQMGWQSIKKNAKRLLLPYLCVAGVLIIRALIMLVVSGNTERTMLACTSYLYGSDGHSALLGDLSIGPVWFLLALFWAKIIVAYLSEIKNQLLFLVCCLLVSLAGVFLNRYILLPWSINHGMTATIFVGIGYYAKNNCLNSKWKYAIWTLLIVSWPLAMIWGDTAMYDCRFKYYGLDVIGACGATMVIYGLSCLLNKIDFVRRFLSWCGTYSLTILCSHQIVWKCFIVELGYKVLGFPNDVIVITMILYLSLALIGTILLKKTPYLRDIL